MKTYCDFIYPDHKKKRWVIYLCEKGVSQHRLLNPYWVLAEYVDNFGHRSWNATQIRWESRGNHYWWEFRI